MASPRKTILENWAKSKPGMKFPLDPWQVNNVWVEKITRGNSSGRNIGAHTHFGHYGGCATRERKTPQGVNREKDP